MEKGNKKVPLLTLIHCSSSGPVKRRNPVRRTENEPALDSLIEKVTVIYKFGDCNARSMLRGLIAEIADEVRMRVGRNNGRV